ncbi:hypothetical protein BFP70_00190 [Thioclava sp. SK-1]|uniref:TadE/TadG family type IV pilus assembly protein n=1 Tax=Thioclava sp. SK-1 TaxID=1889770 RepID=UPI000826A209|nr:TadE/TadG family type IV pilus assembly protein [Thioclava sp. SK-1]OCX66627.1 hypothetical protein BFP70_00190 [Thioclava sp. SK-1]
MKSFRIRSFKALRDDESGSAAIEGVMGALLLLGWYVVAFQFWDAFRTRSTVTKAAYTISDMISRENNEIGPEYIHGLRKVFNYVSDARDAEQTVIRVTLFNCASTTDNGATVDTRPCDGVDKKFTVTQPYSTDTTKMQVYDDGSFNDEHSRIPRMAAGDMAVLVETIYTYAPLFDIGDRGLYFPSSSPEAAKKAAWIGLAGTIKYTNFVVTRPRVTRVTWSDDA